MTQLPKVNYSALSELFAKYPEELSLARFRELNIRNLLYYQAELAHLEAELGQIEDLDATKCHPDRDDRERVTRRWKPVPRKDTRTQSSRPGEQASKEAEQSEPVTIEKLYVEKVLEIRRVLASYNKALKQYSTIAALPSTSSRSIGGVRYWLDRSDFGRSFLRGTVEDVWGVGSGRSNAEFLTFASHKGLTRRLASVSVRVKEYLSKSDPEGVYYTDSSEEGGIAQGVSVVVSSMFPVLPIIILFFVKPLLIRIVLILVFTALFAAVLVFGLHIKPEKCLAITTAIAAVQVVFVGSNSNDGCK